MRNKTPEEFGCWGVVFEAAVKVGALNYLASEHQIDTQQFEHLSVWEECHVSTLSSQVRSVMGVTDPLFIERIDSYCCHLMAVGYGVGYTTLREWFKSIRPKSLTSFKQFRIDRLWCPLSFSLDPGEKASLEEKNEQEVRAFWEAMGLSGPVNLDWAKRGGPVKSDFLMQVSAPKNRTHLLCLEFSMNVPFQVADFSKQDAHLDELLRRLKWMQCRGVFSHIQSEVSGERFDISEDVISHLAAFTSRDKPFYKLCQGASYASEFVERIEERGQGLGPVEVCVLAVTAAGIEGLTACLGLEGPLDAKAELLKKLGRLYRNKMSLSDSSPLIDELRGVFRRISNALPPNMGAGVRKLMNLSPENQNVRFSEQVEGFLNPVTPLSRETLLGWLQEQPELAQIFGKPVREMMLGTLEEMGKAEELNLRDVHSAAIRAGVASAPKGKLTILALEGHPGIGKTYSTTRALARFEEEGYLFFYASPRVVINNSVTEDIARLDNEVLTLTTNSRINRGAPLWYQKNASLYGKKIRLVEGGVVCHKPPGFQTPSSPILFLDLKAQAQINDEHVGHGYKNTPLNEQQSLIQARSSRGVMKTLGLACHQALEENSWIRKVVLTGSIQGYRESNTQSTVDCFGRELFAHSIDERNGIAERLQFSKRIPNIVVMIDELAGDGSGPHIVHAFASMLRREFIDPFIGSAEAPFRVIFIIADASLGNEVALERFLSSGSKVPPKILISEGRRDRPFAMTYQPIRLGGRMTDALHIMADAFPASRLEVDYSLHLCPVEWEEKEGKVQNRRGIILSEFGDPTMKAALDEIVLALEQTPPEQQIIFFAQDKKFLRGLEETLVCDEALAQYGLSGPHGKALLEEEVAKLDGSVPDYERRRLVLPEVRDSKRVFLMTSSGSRGVSFPRATTIIAQIPDFSVESGLMELAQLIFRGRGGGGDLLQRRLVMMLNDYVFMESGQMDVRRWVRQMVDFVTVLVLIRATIFTRIRGDAGLRHQSLSVIPVGHIGSEKVLQTMSHSLHSFLHEADVFIRGKGSPEDKDLVGAAYKHLWVLFGDAKWEGHFQGQMGLSITWPSHLRSFLNGFSSIGSPLMKFSRPTRLPARIFCDGSLWLERWGEAETHEFYGFDLTDQKKQKAMQDLIGCLNEIESYGRRRIPSKIRWAAKELRTILRKSYENVGSYQESKKRVESEDVWVAVPVDLPRFFPDRKLLKENDERWVLKEQELWHEALRASVSIHAVPSVIHPVLPVFQDFPHVAMVTSWDPLGFAQVFDNRYFLVSRELNLLSTLIFA